MKKNYYSLFVFLLINVIAGLHSAFAQTIEISNAVYSDVSIPLRDMKPTKKPFWTRWKLEVEPEREIPNKFRHYSFDPVVDRVVQTEYYNSNKAMTSAPIQNFDGMNNGNNTGRVTPPDPAGDVGPNHYVQAVNLMLQMYTKTGTTVYGPVPTSTIWDGFNGNWTGNNDGDPIILYDENADRWIISQFAIDCGVAPYTQYQLVAVSTTPDPTGSYYRYAFQFDYMPDYPKIGIWEDGYYMAINRFNSNNSYSWVGAGAVVMERSKMLNGDPAAGMMYYKTETIGGSGSATGSDCYSMLPSDCDGTFAATGTPNYFTYVDPYASELRIWAFHADWITPLNSTFTFASSLPVTAYNSLGSVSQLGTTLTLDGLGDRLMFRNQYRNFGSYETFVTCHNVNAGSGIAGMRWYEYRKTGATFSLYQQSTYAPPDGKSRWMGSIAMNAIGDIGIAYSVSSSTMNPSIYFTGRKAADPLNQLTIPEGIIYNGTVSMTGTYTRWGDYTAMSIDPSDNVTFWTTQEYVGTYGGSYPWSTRIASFKFANNPSVTTLPATSVTAETAVLNATVNPNSLTTEYHFEWGTTISYGSSTGLTSVGSGTTTTSVNASISGLIAGTPYHFRIVATNADGTTNGNDITFIPGAAVVTTATISSITEFGAVCGGNVSSDGGSSVTSRGVCWSATINPIISGNHTTDGTGTGAFTSVITGLSPNSTYYFRAYATNGGGTVYGDNILFTTLCSDFALPFSESFSSIGTPTCWSQVDHQGNGQVWQFGAITGQSPNPVLGTNYAYLNSDAYGSGNSQNADLISPTLDLSLYTNVAIQFDNYFLSWSGSSGALSYSINNGSTWTLIDPFSSTSSSNPFHYTKTVSGVAGQSLVKFKWNYTGTWGYYWAIDNISITGITKNMDVHVLLEGPFNTTSNTMNTSLGSLVPLTQPYSGAPWNYNGIEQVGSVPAGVVDWVLVELRDAASPGLATLGTRLSGWPKAYFIKTDGSIVGLDGVSLPIIGNPVVSNNLYAVVRHRNHIAVISQNPLSLTGDTYSYDFSTALTQAYGGVSGYKEIATGIFGMVNGDSDSDGGISVLDFSNWATSFGLSGSYLTADNDFDTQVTVLDFSRWATNFGLGSGIVNGIVNTSYKYKTQVPSEQ